MTKATKSVAKATPSQFLASIAAMTPEALRKVLTDRKLTQDTPERELYLAKYILQEENAGLKGLKAVVAAKRKMDELFKTLPHLETVITAPVVENSLSMAIANLSGEAVKGEPVKVAKPTKAAKPVTAPKAAKPVVAPAPKAAKKAAKVSYDVQDGTVLFRPDRNKWVAFTNGQKQECARPTAEACVKWMAAKYPTLVPVIIK